MIKYSDKMPTSGTGFYKNQIIYNTNISESNPYLGWVCVEGYGKGEFNQKIDALVDVIPWQGYVTFSKEPVGLRDGDKIRIEGINDTEFTILEQAKQSDGTWVANIEPITDNNSLTKANCYYKNPVYKPFGKIEY